MSSVMRTNSGGNDGDRELVFNIEGKRFARMILPSLNDEARRLPDTLLF